MDSELWGKTRRFGKTLAFELNMPFFTMKSPSNGVTESIKFIKWNGFGGRVFLTPTHTQVQITLPAKEGPSQPRASTVSGRLKRGRYIDWI